MRLISANIVRSSILLPFGMLLNFVMTIYIAKLLSTSEFGLFSSVVYWGNFLALVFSLGLPISAQKHIPFYAAKYCNGEIACFLRLCHTALMVVLVLALVITLLAFLYGSTYVISIVLFAAVNLIWIYQRYIALGFDDVFLSILPRDIIFPLFFLILLSALSSISYSVFLILYSSILFFVLAAAFWFMWREHYLKIKSKAFLNNPLGVIWDSIPFAIGRIGQLGTSGIEVLVIGMFLSMQEVGVYAFVFKIALLGGLVTRILSVSSGQHFAKYYSLGQFDMLTKLYIRSTIFSVVISAIFLVLTALFGERILAYVSPDYVDGYSILLILVLGQVLSAALGPVVTVLNMTNNQAVVAYITSAGAIINLVLCYVLLPDIGLIGVAIVISVGSIATRIAQLYILFLNVFKLGGKNAT